MALSDVLMRVVGFLRAGYPEGVPAYDYIPERIKRRLTAVGWPVTDSFDGLD